VLLHTGHSYKDRRGRNRELFGEFKNLESSRGIASSNMQSRPFEGL
jgi:hypothetical protein